MAPLVRIWSDYTCPFCYVGIERAAWLEERYGAEIEWLPFDLHPEYPPDGIAMEQLEARFGRELRSGQRAMFAAAGLPYAERTRIPSSRAALNVAELARERGVHPQLHHRLMTGFWAEDRDIGSVDVLVEEATAFGLDADEVRDVATTHPYRDRIQASTQAVYEMGASGVPAFVIDDRMLIPGAQPHALFEKAMARLDTSAATQDQ